jgi:hypothetical protein
VRILQGDYQIIARTFLREGTCAERMLYDRFADCARDRARYVSGRGTATQLSNEVHAMLVP